MTNEEAYENRFKYLREYSTEDLEALKEELARDIETYLKKLTDDSISSEEKSEILNSDLIYDRQRIAYINNLLKEREIKKL